ncbi:MAG: hypothetical protein OEW89_02305 [Gammaproteobacteria bacterium]|nr:hypothetical protein [Gammaproteobacteria bacterium]
MENEYFSLICAYREKFDEGPPTWELTQEEAMQKMKEALKTGEKMKGFDMSKLPPDTLL